MLVKMRASSLKVTATLWGWIVPLVSRTKTFRGFMATVWKHKPIYFLSSLSLLSWAIVLWHQADPNVLKVYPAFALLPFPTSTIIYVLVAFSWPVFFYRGDFKAARVAILGQGIVHIMNGMTFLPGVFLEFPGALPRAVTHMAIGAILIASWHDTPLIKVDKVDKVEEDEMLN